MNETLEAFQEGKVLLIDKPLHWTSFQTVNHLKWKLKRALGIKKIKIGHAGTLDPLATGLLVVCTGKKTKTIQEIQDGTKVYTGTFRLGATTPSFDLETKIDATFPIDHITPEKIAAAAQQFVGAIQQVPPIFSAIKKDGKKLYEYARKGQDVAIQSRPIVIYSFECNAENFPDVDFKLVCSKGTYVRSLAHDFGAALNSGAHLTALRREQSGDFHVENAIKPEDFLGT
jgi:tRNA pseudouridine55 synthase